MKRSTWSLLAALPLVALAAAWLAWPSDQFVPATSAAAWQATPDNVARGAYLARVGDCMSCHTARGGAAYAGGRALTTPFGTLYGPNLTPDKATGLGDWSADQFWAALHNGRGREGQLLYPAFPFPHYTRTSRADSDALYAYLRTVPPRHQQNRPHGMHFPFNLQLALAGWRLFFFKPGVFEADPRRGADWNRGAYLVQGLGHCSACHSSRNVLGASDAGLSGGMIPVIGWYAPSLTSDAEAGLGSWRQQEVIQLLHTGVSARATVFGPMAEVVSSSLQYLSDADANAMASYLKALPSTPNPAAATEKIEQALIDPGKRLYDKHCQDCHGGDGKGMPLAYPPLAGNRALTMASPVNAIRIVLNGGFAPGTKGNPRPYGMPPFAHVLADDEVAQVVTYLRSSWGNQAGAVTPAIVNQYRGVPLD